MPLNRRSCKRRIEGAGGFGEHRLGDHQFADQVDQLIDLLHAHANRTAFRRCRSGRTRLAVFFVALPVAGRRCRSRALRTRRRPPVRGSRLPARRAPPPVRCIFVPSARCTACRGAGAGAGAVLLAPVMLRSGWRSRFALLPIHPPCSAAADRDLTSSITKQHTAMMSSDVHIESSHSVRSPPDLTSPDDTAQVAELFGQQILVLLTHPP